MADRMAGLGITRLGIPAGSIGPSRGRCLDKLRRYPAIAALIVNAAHDLTT